MTNKDWNRFSKQNSAAAVTHKIVQNGAIEACLILNSSFAFFDVQIDSNYIVSITTSSRWLFLGQNFFHFSALTTMSFHVSFMILLTNQVFINDFTGINISTKEKNASK